MPIVKCRRKTFTLKPFMTTKLRNCSLKKNKLYSKFLRIRTKDAELRYKLYKNKFINNVRSAEKAYYKSKLTECTKDTKETWKILKNVLNKKQKHFEFPNKMSLNGIQIDTIRCVPNEFNVYFTNIGPTLARKIPPVGDYMKFLKTRNNKTFYLSPITRE